MIRLLPISWQDMLSLGFGEFNFCNGNNGCALKFIHDRFFACTNCLINFIEILRLISKPMYLLYLQQYLSVLRE